ncbi:MAG: ribosomal protein [Planctomycetota bacterium]|jgi:small subunit ribosomal protein S8|nr:30S ribosomal protein S8 [Phycisphaerae bacterium]MBU6208722.1 30S ribosomal protein S8 [Planctomycetota bacterium]MDI9410448.1 30S ribosomal protein S8 [Bacteroidia bacterium]RLS50529.1 MAG: 30S ribosomal protein S8 [Planctomycetota bacterium]RLS53041.1 MAG: 30S ribosomal protein S8 [Planctomycetota bacterium]
MSLQDLTADMLTRIRNAVKQNRKSVTCLNNKLNRGILQVLVDEGYLGGFEVVDDGRQGVLRVALKYGERGESLIHRLERVSSVGCRIYKGCDSLPRPQQGLGIAIVSTSRGVMSDRKAREMRVGGEVVATVS